MSLTLRSEPDPLDSVKPNPDTDYAQLAEANWVQAQLHARRLRELAEEILLLTERVRNGEKWVLMNRPTPKEFNLLISVRENLDAAKIEMASYEIACWRAVCSAYVAMRMSEIALEITRINGERGNTPSVSDSTLHSSAWTTARHSPIALWHLLVGERDAPGTWPPTAGEENIELAAWPYSVGVWMLPELEDLLRKGKDE